MNINSLNYAHSQNMKADVPTKFKVGSDVAVFFVLGSMSPSIFQSNNACAWDVGWKCLPHWAFHLKSHVSAISMVSLRLNGSSESSSSDWACIITTSIREVKPIIATNLRISYFFIASSLLLNLIVMSFGGSAYI